MLFEWLFKESKWKDNKTIKKKPRAEKPWAENVNRLINPKILESALQQELAKNDEAKT